MRRLLFALVLGVSACEAPPIRLADAGTDGGVDAPKTCPTVYGPDGAPCTGPDEDGDCIPDTCDDCPNVPQPLPPGRAGGIATVGRACVHPSPPFDQLAKRLRFDACTTPGPWSPTALNEADRWSVREGVAGLGQAGGAPTWALLSSAANLEDVSVLARIRLVEGETAGILLRVDTLSSLRGYFCLVDAGKLRIVESQACTVSGCNLLLPLDDGGVPSMRPIPIPDTSQWFYLRATVVGRTLECQAYPASDDPGGIRLREAPPNGNTVRAVVPESQALLARGNIGFFARFTRLEVSSVDVLGR